MNRGPGLAYDELRKLTPAGVRVDCCGIVTVRKYWLGRAPGEARSRREKHMFGRMYRWSTWVMMAASSGVLLATGCTINWDALQTSFLGVIMGNLLWLSRHV